jgi:hypothetical protein
VSDQDMPPCFIFIDKEGHWFHKGTEMIRRDIVRFFYDHLGVDSLGRYVIRWGEERCHLDVEDTPFVVHKVSFEEIDLMQNFRLFLSDDTDEILNPETLFVGAENVLYCEVKQREFPARFLRSAYYQMTDFVREEEGEFHLPLNGKKYLIRPKNSE